MKLFKTLGLIAIATTTSLVAFSCVSVSENNTSVSGREQVTGSGNIVSKNISVSSDFNQISVPSIIDVVITQGSSNAITVKGSDNLINYCKIEVANNILNVNLSKEADYLSFKKFDVKVYVTATDLNEINISGTGDVDFKGPFAATKLNFDITGTGDIIIPDLKAKELSVSIAGTGDVKVKGTCDKASLSVTGTGDINAYLTGLTNLEASISGTGDIELGGSTVNAKYIVNGTGDIEAKDMKAAYVNASANGTGDIECFASESFTGFKSTTADLKCYGNPAKYNLKKN